MNALTIKQLLINWNIVCRVVENYKKFTVTFYTHPSLVDVLKNSQLEHYRPIGITHEFKPMRLWDYWKCRKQLVVLEDLK